MNVCILDTYIYTVRIESSTIAYREKVSAYLYNEQIDIRWREDMESNKIRTRGSLC